MIGAVPRRRLPVADPARQPAGVRRRARQRSPEPLPGHDTGRRRGRPEVTVVPPTLPKEPRRHVRHPSPDSTALLPSVPANITGGRTAAPSYDRSRVAPGHRAHRRRRLPPRPPGHVPRPADEPGPKALDWGIVGLGVMPSDVRMRDALSRPGPPLHPHDEGAGRYRGRPHRREHHRLRLRPRRSRPPRSRCSATRGSASSA
jgi:hypothetical protein